MESFMYSVKILLFTLFLILVTACTKNKDDTSTVEKLQSPVTFNVTREKVDNGLDNVLVSVTLADPQESVIPAVSRGGIDSFEKVDATHYSFRLIPEQTGEYKITVEADGLSYSKTVLVLQDVADGWGQPQMVEGLVNTEGYEDGVTITPDGEYLFVHTAPYRLSSLFVYNTSRADGGCGGSRVNPSRCEHPWINTLVGTYTAPKRPGFFDGRFNGDLQRHNALSWGLGDEEAPVFAISSMFYGFKRQADGSFAEPFYMAFDDLNDGLIGPYGLTFVKQAEGRYRTLFSHKDAYTTGGGFDIYRYDAEFGRNNNFGSYVMTSKGNPPARGTEFSSILVDLGDNNGTQGNPFIYSEAGVVKSIWTDDEYDGDADSKKISVYLLNSGTFPESSDWRKVLLPSNVNQTGSESRQPTYVDGQLYFTQDVNVVVSAYSGSESAAGYADALNWSIPKTLLQKDTSYNFYAIVNSDLGKIVAVGEPTIADYGDKRILYFVYGYIRGIDPITGLADMDMQAGFIEQE